MINSNSNSKNIMWIILSIRDQRSARSTKYFWYIFFWLIGLLFFFSSAYGQSTLTVTPEWVFCPEIVFNLLWQDEVKQNQLYEYSVISDDFDAYASGSSVKQMVRSWPDQLAQYTDWSFSHNFEWEGLYLVQSEISLDNGCVYTVEKNVNAYENIIIYLWVWSEILELSKQTESGTWDYNLLFKNISTDWFTSDDKLFTHLSTFVPYFKNADRMVIDTKSQWQLFDILGRILAINDIDMTSSEVYVIADITQSYFRRLLARYITAAGIEKVFVTKKQYFGSLFTSLLLWEDPQEYDFIKSYSVSLDESNKRAFLSYMTDYLLFNGFPLGILTLILLLPFLWLLISIARQVVWLSVFGVFTPLLFGVSMLVIWVGPSLILLLAAALAVTVVFFITKKIYLLYSPKISLMLILYCIFTILLRRAHNILDLNLVEMSSYTNSFAIFPFVCILLVAKWVFSDSFLQFKKWRIISLWEFVLVSFLVLYILQSDYLQNIFLWNPELILVVFALNILVGRFTGLQLLEYFRFFPLIKNYFEEE